MSHTYKWMSHGTLMNASSHAPTNKSCHTYERVAQIFKMPPILAWLLPPIYMSHGTIPNASYHTPTNESCHTCECRTFINETCHTYDWGMSHMWLSHVTHMIESFHTFDWVMSHIGMSHDWVMSHRFPKCPRYPLSCSRHFTSAISVFAPHAITRSTRLLWSLRYHFSKVASQVTSDSRWSTSKNFRFRATHDYAEHAPFVVFEVEVQFLKSPS